MKLYNISSGKIQNLDTIKTPTSEVYVDKLSPLKLDSLGYLKVQYKPTPDTKYNSFVVDGNIKGPYYVVDYIVSDLPITTVQERMKRELKTTFEQLSAHPIVDTGLGFSVDGRRTDKDNFIVGKKHFLANVKAADNTFHTVTDAQYDTIITAIESAGIDLYNTKWTKEVEIEALTTIEECKLYEATPYLVEGVTKYKNNVKEW